MKKLLLAAALLLVACAHNPLPYRDRYHSGDYVKSDTGAIYMIEAVSGDTLRLRFLATGETLFMDRDAVRLEFITDSQSEYEMIMVFL